MPLRLYTVAMRALRVFLAAVFAAPIHAGSWKQLGDDIDGAANNEVFGTAVAMTKDGSRIVAGAPGGKIVRVYDWNGTAWNQAGDDIAKDKASSGKSIAISDDGNVIAFGAPDATTSFVGNTGTAYVYYYDGTAWVGRGPNGGEVPGAQGNRKGASVALSADGNIVAVGAPKTADGNERSFVFVYKWDGTNYNLYHPTRTDLGDDRGECVDGQIYSENTGDAFGTSVSLSHDGRILAVGATHNEPNTSTTNHGHVRVFNDVGWGWQQVGADIEGEDANDLSGISVSLSADGSRVAIGAHYANVPVGGPASGHVRVYAIDTSMKWTQLGADVDAEGAGDEAGYSVSLSDDGNRLVVGAPSNNGTGTVAGHVRAFHWTGRRWAQIGRDLDGASAEDEYGHAVAMSGDGKRMVVGVPSHDGDDDHGTIQVFEYKASSSSLSTGAIVGISVGGVAFVALVAILATPTKQGKSYSAIHNVFSVDPIEA
jgi:hypothetical protein